MDIEKIVATSVKHDEHLEEWLQDKDVAKLVCAGSTQKIDIECPNCHEWYKEEKWNFKECDIK